MPVSSPDDLSRTRVLFEQWRATRAGRAPVPDELWAATLALCDRYSVSRLCRELHLSARSLRARLPRSTSKRLPLPHPPTPPSAFVPLLAPGPVDRTDAHRPAAPPASLLHLQLERRDGTRLTLSVPDTCWAPIESLCAAFLRS